MRYLTPGYFSTTCSAPERPPVSRHLPHLKYLLPAFLLHLLLLIILLAILLSRNGYNLAFIFNSSLAQQGLTCGRGLSCVVGELVKVGLLRLLLLFLPLLLLLLLPKSYPKYLTSCSPSSSRQWKYVYRAGRTACRWGPGDKVLD